MNNYSLEIFNNVDDIPKHYWEALGCCDNLYYDPKFLKAFELGNDDIEFNYIIVLKNKVPVAFANTQLVTISIDIITKNVKISNRLKTFINNLFYKTEPKILFCGNVFLSGEYGTFLKANESKIETFKQIAKGIKKLSKTIKKTHAIFVKDFLPESLSITNQLLDFNYTPMQVEPNMMIHLKKEWDTFEDYKKHLKSKYRVKANRADALSEDLVTQFFEKQDIIRYKDELQLLYQNTIDNANFNAQVLNLNTYIYLKAAYPKYFIIKGYFIEGKLVGFLTAMKNQNNFDAHFIGINYSLNKTYAIYPRILNDYIRLGIQFGATQINLGRTASEIKSTLGAVPEVLTCYFKHKKYLINQMVKPFIKQVQIKDYKQHQPFKTRT